MKDTLNIVVQWKVRYNARSRKDRASIVQQIEQMFESQDEMMIFVSNLKVKNIGYQIIKLQKCQPK